MFSRLFQMFGSAGVLAAAAEQPELHRLTVVPYPCAACKEPLKDGDMVVKWRGTLTHEACWCNVKKIAVK